MAFFGLTNFGYQNPIGDQMITNLKGPKPHTPDAGVTARAGLPPTLQKQKTVTCTDTCNVIQKSLLYSTDIHHGSHERQREMIKRVQTPRSPNQLYMMPLTDSQQYGWMVSKNPEQWTKVKRFPLKNSEMTRFVNEMSVTNREFTLF